MGKSPLRTDRILVVLSVAKGLRLPPKRLKIFWVELEESHFTSSIELRRPLVALLLGVTNWWEGAKDPFPTNPKKDFLLCHVERSETSPPFLFRVELEEGTFPSSND